MAFVFSNNVLIRILDNFSTFSPEKDENLIQGLLREAYKIQLEDYFKQQQVRNTKIVNNLRCWSLALVNSHPHKMQRVSKK